jgi:hypothetical protein
MEEISVSPHRDTRTSVRCLTVGGCGWALQMLDGVISPTWHAQPRARSNVASLAKPAWHNVASFSSRGIPCGFESSSTRSSAECPWAPQRGEDPGNRDGDGVQRDDPARHVVRARAKGKPAMTNVSGARIHQEGWYGDAMVRLGLDDAIGCAGARLPLTTAGRMVYKPMTALRYW